MTGNGHLPYLMDKPLGEDGYYMLTVAENIAAHGQVMYNGHMEATGIQPLATVVFAGLDWVVQRFHGDRMDLVRCVLILGGVLLLVFAAQVAAITPEACFAGTCHPRPWRWPLLLVLSDYTLFRLFTYGLETGLYLIALAVCICRPNGLQRPGTQYARGRDAGDRRGPGRRNAHRFRADLRLRPDRPAAEAMDRRCAGSAGGGIALLLVSPWFLFVHRVDGTWLPSSGRAESTLVTLATLPERSVRMFFAVLGHLVPWSYAACRVLPARWEWSASRC